MARTKPDATGEPVTPLDTDDDGRETAAVVPTGERRPLGDPEDHHHEGNLGPVNTPAGAHKHSGFEPEHVHLPPPPPPDTRVVIPTPVSEDDEQDEPAGDLTVTADADCKVVYRDQLVTLARGQKVSGELARYLVDTGADVSPVKKG